MSNRVEELESKVAELQAAVDGLTEELVETRERLRQLESEHGVEVKRAPERRDRSETAESAEGANTPEPEALDEETPEPSSEVAPDADEAESSTEEESDIIVA